LLITDNQKILIFVSTGRCGTKRIAEILKEKLPEDKFAVQHQMNISRIANILGNLMYYLVS
jgi:flavodoxin